MGVHAWRFPGGTVSNGYNAAIGKMYENLSDGDGWGYYNDFHPSGLLCEDYAALALSLPEHSQMFVANLYAAPDPTDPTGTTGAAMTTPAEYAQEAARLRSSLEPLPAMGFEPEFIELSNELYITDLWPAITGVDGYAQRITAFTPELKAVYPDVPFAVSLPLDEVFRRDTNGSSGVIGIEDWIVPQSLDFQAIVFHAYVTGWYELNQYLQGNATIADVMTNWFVQVDLGMDASLEHAALVYPGRSTWITEWGVLGIPSALDGSFGESTLRIVQAASMYIEMVGHSEIEVANLHGFIPTLGLDGPTALGGLCTHVNAVIASHSQAISTSSDCGEVLAPIGIGGPQGWGGEVAPALADAMLLGDGAWQWIAVNRTESDMNVSLHVSDLGITVAASEAVRFYTDTMTGTDIDLLVPPTQDTIDLGPVVDGVLALSIPAMGFVSVDIAPTPGDATGDGTIDVNDLLAVIAAWGPCPAPCPADFDGGGEVDVDDLLAVIDNWLL